MKSKSYSQQAEKLEARAAKIVVPKPVAPLTKIVGEPLTLTAQPLPKPKVAKAVQQEIAVPPPTIGERPIIGREATPEEAPLFSRAAQEPTVEQTTLEPSGQE